MIQSSKLAFTNLQRALQVSIGKKFQLVAGVYCLALLFMGLGYISILPPYEGFDEIAHYSAIRQIADTNTLPVYGESFFPQDVAEYTGPMPYDSQKPPYNRGMTYYKFFAQSGWDEQYLQDYREPRPHPVYIPNPQSPNWEIQHPPLYYMLMAIIMKATNGMSFVAETFILRLASYLLAIGGVLFSLVGWRNQNKSVELSASLLGFMLYPIIFPMFFPEFARLGNDSLCMLWNGMAIFLFTRMFSNERQLRWAIGIGIVFGLGLLTKSYFLPITLAVISYMSLRLWFKRDEKNLRGVRLRSLAIVTALSVLIGGWWYLQKWINFGALTGINEAVMIDKGNFITSLIQNFSVGLFIQGCFVVMTTWVWAGTWSLTNPPFILFIPMLLLAAFLVVSIVKTIGRKSWNNFIWLGALQFAVLCSGLIYYILMTIAAFDKGNIIPGYYLHILMPWSAPLAGLGVISILRKKWPRRIFTGLVFYALAFQIAMLWCELALYTGCAVKGDTKVYNFTQPVFCLGEINVIMNHLAIIGWPWLAGLGFMGAGICSLWLFGVFKSQSLRQFVA